MENTAWKFIISDSAVQFQMKSKGKTAAESVYNGSEITVSLMYSGNDTPLTLRSSASAGQAVLLVIRPYRLELWIDGVLCDEEWPFGEPLYPLADDIVYNTKVTVVPAPEEEEKQSFCGRFTDAEGWYPGGGVFVGDCMPYAYDGRYHVLYLKDRHHHRSKWGRGAHQWEHISTTDMKNWDIHPMAVTIDDASEGSICTGSWIYINGMHYLYYTVRAVDGSPALIRRSVSEDGWHFRKDMSFSFTLSDRYWSPSARDPKVTADDNGRLHMFITTTDMDVHRGCLAHLVSEDGEKFCETGSIYTAENESEGEPECSDYFRLGGYYYLIFSHMGRGQYRYSEKPFDDWKIPENPYIPCESVPKCAVWNDRIIFAGFHGIGGYAGSMTFKEAKQSQDGNLIF